ncbi:hypothetical protein [Sulfurimonas sp. HSL3-7]|uniref:hypothetical protein n=1 Tax=Sulfonitrofixus jiaomeiensis TaxID=3131938 RepID=UPI0031FA0073
MENNAKAAVKKPNFKELLRGKKISAADSPEDVNKKISIDLLAKGIAHFHAVQ